MIAQWLAGFFSRTSAPHARQPKRNGKPHRKQTATQKPATPFRSVSIVSTGRMCPAAERTSKQIFLAAHAPQLPLGGCSNCTDCKCRYKYHTDRRQDVRRDQDVGLPGQPYRDTERRYIHGLTRPFDLGATTHRIFPGAAHRRPLSEE